LNKRKILITFNPKFENVDLTRAAIQGICCGIYPAAESGPKISELCLAATEAMNNAVEHSGAKNITVEVLADENTIVLKLTSKGEEFDPTANVSFPDLDQPTVLPEGGFGRAIIREMVDLWKYEYIKGRNVLTLKKCF
jgi:anti-sigma regulatory factor (Ser/Thr protein kinase)